MKPNRLTAKEIAEFEKQLTALVPGMRIDDFIVRCQQILPRLFADLIDIRVEVRGAIENWEVDKNCLSCQNNTQIRHSLLQIITNAV